MLRYFGKKMLTNAWDVFDSMQASYLHHSQAESDSGGGEFYLSEMPL